MLRDESGKVPRPRFAGMLQEAVFSSLPSDLRDAVAMVAEVILKDEEKNKEAADLFADLIARARKADPMIAMMVFMAGENYYLSIAYEALKMAKEATLHEG